MMLEHRPGSSAEDASVTPGETLSFIFTLKVSTELFMVIREIYIFNRYYRVNK